MALASLLLPLVALADDMTMPPEANWSPTPPARPKVDAGQLMELLVRKGVLTPIEQNELTRSEVATPARDPKEMDRQHGIEYATSP
jgi:hypothetical protein